MSCERASGRSENTKPYYRYLYPKAAVENHWNVIFIDENPANNKNVNLHKKKYPDLLLM